QGECGARDAEEQTMHCTIHCGRRAQAPPAARADLLMMLSNNCSVRRFDGSGPWRWGGRLEPLASH
ncbi:MAG: hypothetical protein KKC40_11590, partial [Alphaproteobacteria bacterium]|nr:hypothetical protein [Alphaproteobacteria bacterium]MBU2349455.1 hypothetical protein [Alphaproteobacteria bacterium]MBU2401542.1 hypothetical protein [Alphaproteobacteria bacterium]